MNRTAIEHGAFVKRNDRAPPGSFASEAEGLRWLSDAQALRVPRVLAVSERSLTLELIHCAPHARSFDETLGRGLATLHRSGAPAFGFHQDNFLAHLPQPNAALPSWPEFYAERRLLPMAALAHERGQLSQKALHAVERVCANMQTLCGPPESPARLHGDLWNGNVIADEAGQPVLIDPAVYGGHREIDLAMMRLFGGFSSRCFDAYAEAWPLAAGAANRVQLYQLFPLLVHAALFGGHYGDSALAAAERYL